MRANITLDVRSFTFKQVMNKHKFLLLLTFFYVNFSALMFFIAWLKAPWNYITSVLFIALSVFQYYKLSKYIISEDNTSSKNLLLLAFMAAAVTLLAGVSGIGGTSTFDIRHHLQKVFDISTKSLPIFYSTPESYASYYFGFYIIPGWMLPLVKSLNLLLLFYEVVGLFIGFYWLTLFTKKKALVLILLFLMSGLLSILVPLFQHQNLLKSEFFYFFDTRWNLLPMYLAYRWVPNQFIYAVILSGLVVSVPSKQLPNISTLLISGLFWAPFVAISVGLIFCCRIMASMEFKKEKNRDILLYLAFQAFLAGFMLLFLAGNLSSTSFEFTLINGTRLANYFALICAEILVFYLLIKPEYCKKPELKAALVLLLTLPLLKLGIGNDLYSRASLPALLILYFYFANSLLTKSRYHWFKIALTVLVALLPLKYMGFGALNFSLTPTYTPSSKEDTFTLIEKDYNSRMVAEQYLLSKESFFYKHLLNKNEETDQPPHF